MYVVMRYNYQLLCLDAFVSEEDGKGFNLLFGFRCLELPLQTK